MERKEVQGEWWLPENSDHKVPGTLVIDEDAIELTLLGSLRDHTASGIPVPGPDGETQGYDFTEESVRKGGVYPRIVGESGMQGYTLEDCFQIQRTNLFGGGLKGQVPGSGVALRSFSGG
ncbi:hypothetical protein KG112_14615 [Nocardioides sp. zg-ZUI104]|uniref:ApeA N-terminal domain 1-containing protein n=1 Tax=Nocardioides faecalis TaxID=2803858 RepID=UPI001BCE8043|nr:hypothetical protein [Nocardioides faecalis]MBS4754044.1 hypothetical protein [Nocardioides faecalis]